MAIVQRGRNRKVRVHRITEAPKALSEDVSARQRKYAISMGIRVVAFILAAIAPLPVPFRVLLMIAALVIPYIAVVYANGGREPTAGADSPYEPPTPRAISPTTTVLGSPHPDHANAGDNDQSENRDDGRGGNPREERGGGRGGDPREEGRGGNPREERGEGRDDGMHEGRGENLREDRGKGWDGGAHEGRGDSPHGSDPHGSDASPRDPVGSSRDPFESPYEPREPWHTSPGASYAPPSPPGNGASAGREPRATEANGASERTAEPGSDAAPEAIPETAPGAASGEAPEGVSEPAPEVAPTGAGKRATSG